jgi:hypothetical protein
VPPSVRFRGFPPETTEFLTEHADTPPSRWSGADRASYATSVLAPLKALCADVAARFAEVTPPIAAEARVGGSLVAADEGPDSPVCRIRLWDAAGGRDRSPLLFVELRPDGVEIGVTDPDPAARGTTRLRGALLPDRSLRAHVADLPASGWTVRGVPLADAADGSVPEDLRPWMLRGGLRVSLVLPWSEWTAEPGLGDEIVDRLREVLPLFDAMRRDSAAGAGAVAR